jgi:hypothetical protein
MLKDRNIVLENLKIEGIEDAFRGMRNPKNSWGESDTKGSIIGSNDLKLGKTLVKAGSDHAKFMRQIQVWFDINLPRYIWSQFDTYSYFTSNSCSTMHKLMYENITNENFDNSVVMHEVLLALEELQIAYKKAKEDKNRAEQIRYLETAKQILPEGWLQKRTINTNYANILNMYRQRHNHPMKIWGMFLEELVAKLPYFEYLCDIEIQGV